MSGSEKKWTARHTGSGIFTILEGEGERAEVVGEILDLKNARLVASAPRLLRTLDRIVGHLQGLANSGFVWCDHPEGEEGKKRFAAALRANAKEAEEAVELARGRGAYYCESCGEALMTIEVQWPRPAGVPLCEGCAADSEEDS